MTFHGMGPARQLQTLDIMLSSIHVFHWYITVVPLLTYMVPSPKATRQMWLDSLCIKWVLTRVIYLLPVATCHTRPDSHTKMDLSGAATCQLSGGFFETKCSVSFIYRTSPDPSSVYLTEHPKLALQTQVLPIEYFDCVFVTQFVGDCLYICMHVCFMIISYYTNACIVSKIFISGSYVRPEENDLQIQHPGWHPPHPGPSSYKL